MMACWPNLRVSCTTRQVTSCDIREAPSSICGRPTPFSIIIARIGSKQEPQRELDLPRSRRRRGDDPCGGAIFTALENHRVRFSEAYLIENVEDLRPQLQAPSLVNGEFFEERSVEVNQSRPGERPALHVPESPESGLGVGQGIEILARLLEPIHA